MKRITVNFWSVNGRKRWVVSSWQDGRRVRAHFDSKSAAEDHAAELRDQVANAGEVWLALPPSERHKLLRAYQTAKDAGLDLESVVRDALKAPGSLATPSVTLSAVATEIVRSKRASGLSGRYCGELGNLYSRFCAGREALAISKVTFEDVDKFMATLPPGSRPTQRARLSTLFGFAVRRGYINANPVDRLEPYKVVRSTPHVFSVEQVELILNWMKEHPTTLGWFVLSCFAGLRPEEADRTHWSAIDWNEKLIRVEGQTSKTGQRRIVYPHAMVFDWLALARKLKAELPIFRHRRMDAIFPLREILGLKGWPQDATRHTAASYWVAESSNLSAVAQALGHSEVMLRKHYLARVTRTEAERFWGLKPSFNLPPQS